MRRLLQHEGDLRDPSRHAFGGSQVERHSCPAAIVYVNPYCRVGLGVGIGGNAIFFQVATNQATTLPSGGVLAAGRVSGIVGGNLGGRQHLGFLCAQL